MNKIKSFMLSLVLTTLSVFTYTAVPSLVAVAMPIDTAEAAECTMYESIHPNFPLTGAHLSTGKCSTCASCHAGGVFLGTPKICATCHNGAPTSPTVGRSSAHPPIGQTNCDGCHNTTSFTATWSMQHSTVGNQLCSSCHNNSFLNYGAMGKDQNHITTTAECSTCHQTVDNPTHTNADWLISMNAIHAGITTGCLSCHDGTHHPALGKIDYAPGHPATSDQCETCHSISAAFKCASLIDDKVIRDMMKKKLFS